VLQTAPDLTTLEVQNPIAARKTVWYSSIECEMLSVSPTAAIKADLISTVYIMSIKRLISTDGLRFWMHLFAACWLLAAIDSRSAHAQFCCGFGGMPSSFSNRVRNAQNVVLAEILCSKPGMDENSRGTTTVQIRRVLKGESVVEVHLIISLNFGSGGAAGDSFLIYGDFEPATEQDPISASKAVTLTKLTRKYFEWFRMEPASPCRLGYFQCVTEYDQDAVKGLAYFLPFLETDDVLAATDAFAEFNQARLQDLMELAPALPRMKLRQWIRNPKTDADRIGRYGLLLGLCGNVVDAKFLAEMISDRVLETSARLKQHVLAKQLAEEDEVPPPEAEEEIDEEEIDFSYHLSGLMKGYLLLRGERALAQLEAQILQDPASTTDQNWAVLFALDFIGTEVSGRIPNEQLQRAMRYSLRNPATAAYGISTLDSWEDWSAQDEIMTIYDQDQFDNPEIKKAIVSYLKSCAAQNKDVKGPDHKALESAQGADAKLAALRERTARNLFTGRE
jgi:hypothetical protein